ncbi:hypothetical protein [Deinococcus maricopensis]|uniref:Uncharacterized protein n=1 Tax=Deinococcus maricopensis (strain DSM 21211 / LMG 22137 / NRRL B-23946 / LB-34) TaxID=709986 RepID=E8UBD4_DEIML|nr:hypothetical protein [Deinococcus maricopensis]ADV68373.1 hypothetical protein Deima_2743 [Deinococcus maricopensis DSM 21211]
MAVKRDPPVTPPGFLATHDLKERGWTPRLIREFLGAHDAERPNGLKMGRRRLPPVKLYAEERVLDAEREEAFLVAQARAMDARERAERAMRTRRANRERALEEAAASWHPQVDARPLRKGAVRQARAAHADTLDAAQRRLERTLTRVTPAESKQLRALLSRRLDAALAAAYPWFPVPTVDTGAARPIEDPWADWD